MEKSESGSSAEVKTNKTERIRRLGRKTKEETGKRTQMTYSPKISDRGITSDIPGFLSRDQIQTYNNNKPIYYFRSVNQIYID